MIVGEVPVMNQRLIQAYERMSPPRMPDPAFGGISLVGDPDVGLKILQLVVLGGLFGIAHDLQNHHIPSVGKDKSFLFAEGSIKILVQLKAVPEDELVFHLPGVHSVELILGRKIPQDLFLHPHEVPVHIGGFHFQAFHFPIVTDCRSLPGIVDL